MSDRPIDQRPPHPVGDTRPPEAVPSDLAARRKPARHDATTPRTARDVSRPPSQDVARQSPHTVERGRGRDPIVGTEATSPIGALRSLERFTTAGGRKGRNASQDRGGEITRCLDAFLDVRPDDPNVVSPHEQERVLRSLLERLDGCDRDDKIGRKARRVVRHNLELLRLYRQHANALIGG